ncbi:Sulfotransferase family protein [Desulfacinum hydrothermale DSM 13146]|uniref:Sulfotransferase family protein n=1 Tax=Desulfacinum hydrothermale DSM 13146 TaxID=1121390 RepID=A0A1W1XR41_9BACT|nr:sulfotransferase [Desulfacinum hydrothermale]SMC26344.1 Sulfotransferase family protein [Desulfacinum hydrothermale DSM 13146]
MNGLKKILKLKDPEIRAKNLRALRYGVRGLAWKLLRPHMPDPVFIVGCSRAGTSVTYETIRLSRHLLSFGYELPTFWNGLWGPHHNGWHSEGAELQHAKPEHRDAAFKYFYERLGAGWVLDKTCINVLRVPYLYRLFPKACFIYIHRDGRDNVNSLMEGWKQTPRFALHQFLGPLPASVRIDGGRYDDWSFFLPPDWRRFNNASLERVCAHQWVSANRAALGARRLVPPRQWIPIRYEDFFVDPVSVFQRVFERLDLPFEEPIRRRCESLLQHQTSLVSGPPRLAKWKTQNPRAIERVLDVLAPTMRELGYEL